jgi:hypothetical protein
MCELFDSAFAERTQFELTEAYAALDPDRRALAEAARLRHVARPVRLIVRVNAEPATTADRRTADREKHARKSKNLCVQSSPLRPDRA